MIAVHGKVVGSAGGSNFSKTDPLTGIVGLRD